MPTPHAIELAHALLARMVAGRRSAANGFCVSADEVAAALAGHAAPADPAQNERVARAEAELAAAIERDRGSRLARLTRTFGLDAVDLAIVSVLLAPELHHELERVIAFALDDFTRKRPDIGFVARLVGGADRARQEQVLAHLDEGAALHRLGIVTTSRSKELPAGMRAVRLCDRIVAFLRGQDPIDEVVRGFVRIGAPLWGVCSS